MTSQKIHISPIISRSRDNQADIFVKNHAENEMGRLVPDLFFFFKKKIKIKALYKIKPNGQHLNFNIV